MADLLSTAALFGAMALPGVLAALAVFIGKWWPTVLMVAFVIALAV